MLHEIARFYAATSDRVRADGMYRHLIHVLNNPPRGTVTDPTPLCLVYVRVGISFVVTGLQQRQVSVLRDHADLLRAMKLNSVADSTAAEAEKAAVCPLSCLSVMVRSYCAVRLVLLARGLTQTHALWTITKSCSISALYPNHAPCRGEQ